MPQANFTSRPILAPPPTPRAYPIAELNSSVVPTASNTWSSLGLRSPVKVLENPGEDIQHIMQGSCLGEGQELEGWPSG